MNTVAIDSNIYKGVERYAKLHNITVGDVVEKGVLLLIENFQPKQSIYKTKEFQDALAYVSTMQAKGGKPVPADENGLEALVEKKYAQ